MEPTSNAGFTYNKKVIIRANLTPKQEERLKNFKWDRTPEIWDTGFINPSQIVSYYCRKCDKIHEDSPKAIISATQISPKDLDTSIMYKCSHCDESIYLGHLPSPNEIPEEFIRFDETGDFKRPTVDSVNSLLARINKQAEEGYGQSIDKPCYRQDL